MERFRGKVVLVTGAGTGIGLATVRRLTDEGGTVVAAMRTPRPDLDLGGAKAVALDVTDEARWAAVVDEVMGRHGRLDALVNNAGTRAGARIEDTPRALWDEMIRTNLTSVFLGCRAAMPALRRSGGGAIVNVGSITGIRGTEGMVAYSASKSGITTLTASLALDAAPDGIRVNAVAPAAIDTRMVRGMIGEAPQTDEAWRRLVAKHPLGRIGRPEEVAAAIAFLASDDAGFITGQTLAVDGGRSMR